MGSNKGLTALKEFVRYGPSLDSSYKLSLKPSNQLSNTEFEKGGYKPDFEKNSNKTGYPLKEINNIRVTGQGIIWAGTGDSLEKNLFGLILVT